MKRPDILGTFTFAVILARISGCAADRLHLAQSGTIDVKQVPNLFLGYGSTKMAIG